MKMTTAKELRSAGWNWSMIECLPPADEIIRIGKNRVPGHAWKPASIESVKSDPRWIKFAEKAGIVPADPATCKPS